MKNQKIIPFIHVSLIVFILNSVGICLVILPKQAISDVEKRKLSPFPAFSLNKLATGKYMDSIDLFTADHFPLRNSLLLISDYLKILKGIQYNDEKVYAVEAIDEIESKEKTINEKDSVFEDKKKMKNSKGLLVTHGQGIQIFSNEEPLNKPYASMINEYRRQIGKETRLFCAIAPTIGAYQMPTQYAQFFGKEKENINDTYRFLDTAIVTIPVLESLKKHENEYIFYRTDHHWTGLGAYYAYTAFCEKAGLTPITLEQMQQKSIDGTFLGTHYLATRDNALEEKADSVLYWIPSGIHQARKLKDGKMVETPVFKTESIEKNKYLVFLGGDEPLMHLKSGLVNNGKTILLIKNSYGNPFSIYFLANYENVWIVDYRYFKGKILNIIEKSKVNDVAFVSGIFATNEPSHIKKIKELL